MNDLLKKANYNTKVFEIDTTLSSLDGKITKNKNKFNGITNDTILFFLGNILFNNEDGFQAYLMFQPVYRHFKTVTNTNYILSWESKGLSAESIKPPTTSHNTLTRELSYVDYNIRVKFTGSCLKNQKLHML